MTTNDPNLNELDGPTVPPVSTSLRGRLQKCYEHGTKLMQQDKYDYDYANTLFTECVARDPGNLIYVEEFLKNLQRKFKNNKKGSKLLGFGGGKGNLKKLAAKNDWMGVIAAGLDLLKGNPWDVPTLRTVAKACEALQLNEVELRFLKNALDAKPKDSEVNRHCARSLGRMGQYDMAIACWHRVEESSRSDREAAQMISALTLEKNRAGAGFGEAVKLPSSPISHKEKPTAPETAGESLKKIELTPRQKLDRAILDDPTIVENYIKLAQLLAAENRHGEAETVAKRGLSASGGDVKVLEVLEDLQINRARAQLAIAKRRAASDPSDDHQDLAHALEADLLQRELEIYHARYERYPEDNRLRYELGVRLKRVGKLDEAIETLSAAAADERISAAAGLEMGMCLQQKKDYQGAMQAYRQAIANAAEQPIEVKKKALYLAGRLALGLKDTENGRKYLGKVHEIDPNYRDTSALLQNR